MGPTPPELAYSAVSDDRGHYRIAGLPPGIYRVSVPIAESYFRVAAMKDSHVLLVPQRSGVADLKVFASDALKASEARAIAVEDGDELQDVDIVIPESRLHSIGGTVMRHGAPAGGIVLLLRLPDGTEQSSTAMTMADGNYRFDLLPAGSYAVEARPQGDSADGKTAAGVVRVSLGESDVLDANVVLGTEK